MIRVPRLGGRVGAVVIVLELRLAVLRGRRDAGDRAALPPRRHGRRREGALPTVASTLSSW